MEGALESILVSSSVSQRLGEGQLQQEGSFPHPKYVVLELILFGELSLGMHFMRKGLLQTFYSRLQGHRKPEVLCE